MSASATPSDVAPGPVLPTWLRRLAPAEGTFSVFFVALMAMTVGWSFGDAAWVLSQREWGDFYPWAALLGVLVGVGGAKARWPRWVVHLVGAVTAALILPLWVGSSLLPDGGSPGELYRATANAVTAAWVDLAILNRPVTNETGHFLLAIGAICWSVGQFAGYAVFGHRRPLDAVIVVGVVLLANMAVTVHNQLWFLVIFTIAGLCVLARSHAFEEQTTWMRRRIGDASEVRAIYLRGGAVFISLAVFGSLVLTASASSAPLAGAWKGFGDTLVDWSQTLQRYLPWGGAPRPVGFGFGSTATISGQWTSSDALAVTIQRPPDDDTPYYWRAVAYDRFELSSWSWTAPREVQREAGARTLDQQAEDPDPAAVGRREVTFTVEHFDGVSTDFVLSPMDPMAIDQAARLTLVGGRGWFSGIEIDNTDRYQVIAAIPLTGDADRGVTANRLRAAAINPNYPDEVKRLYLQRDPAIYGRDARALLASFIADAGSVNSYDLALTMEQRFKRRGGEFDYATDVRGLCEPVGIVECFARYKRGYCQHYATTMAMLLREAGTPARVVQGFLPGQLNRTTGLETIKASAAHAWVEVYFPSIGWYPFDPTGGGLSRTPGLESGAPVTPAPSVLPSFGSVRGDNETDPDLTSRRPGDAGPTVDSRGNSSPGLMIAVAIVLLVALAGLGFVAWQRGPRGEVTAEGVWSSIGRLAGRFGFGPRPQQTVYEYAGALGDVLPGSKPELQAVARAKVEVAYGRRELGDDTRRALRDAQRRLRVGLLRLAFRRKDRPRRR